MTIQLNINPKMSLYLFNLFVNLIMICSRNMLSPPLDPFTVPVVLFFCKAKRLSLMINDVTLII